MTNIRYGYKSFIKYKILKVRRQIFLPSNFHISLEVVWGLVQSQMQIRPSLEQQVSQTF